MMNELELSNKLELLKLKKEIYQNVYDGIVLGPENLAETMSKIDAQIELLKEIK